MRHVAPALCAAGSIAAGCTAAPRPTPSADAVPSWPTLPPADRSGMIPVDGVQLYYAVFNAGGPDPVLLLHGGLSDSNVWAFEEPRLAQRHEVIVIDTRGHGRSTRSAEPFHYSSFATDAIAVLDSLGVRRAAVVGWSDGGITGLILAMRYPDRVSALFTYGTNFDLTGEIDAPPDTAAARRFLAIAQAEYRRVSPAPDDFAGFRGALADLYSREPALTPAELATIHVPTVIAAGEHDQFIARSHTERLAQLIPGARLVIIPKLDHGGPLRDPAAFHAAVARLLDHAGRAH